MTDTGHFPERGQLDPTGGPPAPPDHGHRPATPAYPYHDSATPAEDGDDEDLLMPGSHGAWREPAAPVGHPGGGPAAAPHAPAAVSPYHGATAAPHVPAPTATAPAPVPAQTGPRHGGPAEPTHPAAPAAAPYPDASGYAAAPASPAGPGVLPARPGAWDAAPAEQPTQGGSVPAAPHPPEADPVPSPAAPEAAAPTSQPAEAEAEPAPAAAPAAPEEAAAPRPAPASPVEPSHPEQHAAPQPVEPPGAEQPTAEPAVQPAAPTPPASTPPAPDHPAGAVPPPAADGPSAATQPPEGNGAGEPGEAPAGTGQRPAAASEREAVHRLMHEQVDVPQGFRSDPVPQEALLRVLEAAHTAPVVGHSQPWDFVIIRSPETRRTVHDLATRQRAAHTATLSRAQARQVQEPPATAILDAPVNIVVTADATRGGQAPHAPESRPEHAPHSSALAVENLWLAARAEDLAVGWIGFLDERELVTALGLPEHLEVVAYLCLGYAAEPSDTAPEASRPPTRRPLSWVVHEESYGRRALPGDEPHDLLGETLSRIRPLDAQALGEAWERQRRMTKPTGALGALEVISAQLCGLTRSCPPPLPEPAALAVFAGDHGVHAQGVSSWPQEVTAQMVANFLGGGAVCNAFAAQVGAEVCVIDVGVRGELPAVSGLMPRRIRSGTADFTTGPALTREEVTRALEVGIETARDLVAAGHRALLTGEMGVANTTVSAALVAAFTGAEPAEVTGRGSGADDETYARKVAAVRTALDLHRPDSADPIGVLEAVGGLEHAALTGLILGGAALRVPVILDGVSGGAAALAARAIAPESVSACIAGHRSAEPGHVAGLTALGLRPLVDLDLRLGEGTGALLALPVVQSAARALREVATFDAAGVTDKN